VTVPDQLVDQCQPVEPGTAHDQNPHDRIIAHADRAAQGALPLGGTSRTPGASVTPGQIEIFHTDEGDYWMISRSTGSCFDIFLLDRAATLTAF
jgi:hypothetical protein